jgi:5S rRNA maturation endonuclease (ribonuclease M5)
MKYSAEDIGFIVYNNRSVNGTVKNFLDPNINSTKLIEIEKKFHWAKSVYSNLEKMVEINTTLLDLTADDEVITQSDLSNLSDFFHENSGKYSDNEIDFLQKRKIPIDLVNEWKFLGLSNFKNKNDLVKIGATCHPILKTFLEDGIDEGGIVQPLFKDNKLVNCSIRRLSDVGKLKYTLAVPDVPVWGLDDVENEEVWICEGLFDMITLRHFGVKSVSPSSAMWSGIQLYQLLNKNPKNIIIFSDNDRVGLKTGAIMHKFFNLVGIPSVTIRSKECKDASEHFFEKGLSMNDLEYVKITTSMIDKKNDNSFDFLKYLQNRKF